MGASGSDPGPAEIFLDRHVYVLADRFAHGFVQAAPGRWSVTLRRGEEIVGERVIGLADGGAAQWLLPLGELTPGEYTLSFDGTSGVASRRFALTRADDEGAEGPEWGAGPLSVPVQIVDPGGGEPSHGPWPVRTAVALPRGRVAAVTDLALRTHAGAAEAQFEPLSWWGPDCSSLRWVGLDFVAERGSKGWLQYEVVSPRVPTDAKPIPRGPSRPAPRLDPQAWGDPYTVDRAGLRYEPEGESQWQLESSGSVRTTYVRNGWFVDADGRRHSRFSARLSSFATGDPRERHVGVEHRIVVTQETLALGLRDAGWQVPAPRRRRTRWRSRIDGRPIEGTAAMFAHQEGPDRCRVVELPGRRLRPRVDAESDAQFEARSGARCAGWLSVEDRETELIVALRRMREHFPKEIAWTGDAVVVHFWPKHGRAGDSGEGVSRARIHEARFAHEGPTLELDLPGAYEAELRRLHGGPGPDTGWDAESAIDRALASDRHGVGLAFGGEFHVLRAQPVASADRAIRFHDLVERSPHALQAPASLASTGAEGRWSPSVGDPSIERALTRALPTYQESLHRSGRDLGMWIYPGVHNAWDPRRGVPLLHRVWQASHYRNVSGAWLLYLRSAVPGLLEWARDASRQFRDVHVLHHETAHDPVGAMDHCKGFLPWAAKASVWGHWIDSDALRYRSLLLGDRVAGELYRAWGSALIDARMTLGADREGVATLGEILAYYRHTLDARALVSISEWGETALSRPFEEYREPGSFPGWHREWMARYFELTRDPRLVARIEAWFEAGFEDASAAALLARVSDNPSPSRRVLATSLGRLHDAALQFFESPGEPLDGYGPWRANSGARLLFTAPYLLAAVGEVGIDAPGATPSFYPSAATHAVERGRFLGPGLEVWVLDDDDAPIEIRLAGPKGYGDLGRVAYRWVSPSGRELGEGSVRLGEAEALLRTPSDGETGIYTLECRGYRCPLIAPVSDRPEAAVLAAKAAYRGLGRGRFYWSPLDTRDVALRLRASPGKTPAHPETATPAWLEIRRPDDRRPLWAGTLFHYSDRAEAELVLEATRDDAAPVWSVSSAARFGPTFELGAGSPAVLVWPRDRPPEDGAAVAAASRATSRRVERPNAAGDLRRRKSPAGPGQP